MKKKQKLMISLLLAFLFSFIISTITYATDSNFERLAKIVEDRLITVFEREVSVIRSAPRSHDCEDYTGTSRKDFYLVEDPLPRKIHMGESQTKLRYEIKARPEISDANPVIVLVDELDPNVILECFDYTKYTFEKKVFTKNKDYHIQIGDLNNPKGKYFTNVDLDGPSIFEKWRRSH